MNKIALALSIAVALGSVSPALAAYQSGPSLNAIHPDGTIAGRDPDVNVRQNLLFDCRNGLDE